MLYNNTIFKANFIQMTKDNVRVIDTNDIVAKKMETATTLLREAGDDEYYYPDNGDCEEQVGDGFDGEELTDDGNEYGFDRESADVQSPEEIQAYCDGLIAKANEEIAQMKADAAADAEADRLLARTKGHEEGYNEGLMQANDELIKMREEYEARQNELEADYQRLITELEPQLVEAITSVYNKVFSKGYFNKPEVLIHLVDSAIHHAESDTDIVVRTSPCDYEMICDRREEFTKGINANVEVVIGENLSENEIKIETSHGIIDCGIDTELRELTQTLNMLATE